MDRDHYPDSFVDTETGELVWSIQGKRGGNIPGSGSSSRIVLEGDLRVVSMGGLD